MTGLGAQRSLHIAERTAENIVWVPQTGPAVLPPDLPASSAETEQTGGSRPHLGHTAAQTVFRIADMTNVIFLAGRRLAAFRLRDARSSY